MKPDEGVVDGEENVRVGPKWDADIHDKDPAQGFGP
jgi:hypothetical protein